MNISCYDIRRNISPLRLIFWGGLICVFDLNIHLFDTVFDLLHDLVGILIITWGVFRISGVKVHDHYSTAMLFVKIVAVLSCFGVLHRFFIYQVPLFISVILSLMGFAEVVATVVFCVAMRWLSTEASLKASARSWKVTTLLFTIIYLIPLGTFYLAAIVAIAIRETINIALGPAGMLLLPVFFIPLIHLFLSTSRMKKEVKRSALAETSGLVYGRAFAKS